jgi:6-pyruvoyltetrahydropterin/6-carboxytetrahydropterin synthase
MLPNVPADHKCSRLHGHSFRVEIHVKGNVEPESGWIIDFAEIDNAFRPLFAQLDHQYLNEVEGLSNPTSENLAQWIWSRISMSLKGLYMVIIRETCTSGCAYEGPPK